MISHFREFVAVVLLGLFGWAFALNPHDQVFIGAILAAFAASWGYYLGGSKVGADTATQNAAIVHENASAATATAAALASGPQPVEIVNPPDTPVPTKDASK
jgi:hypothetical protein